MESSSSHHDYAKYSALTFAFAGSEIRVVSKPGLPDWDQLLPAEGLLMEAAILPPIGQSLLLGCHHGALAVHLARQLRSPASLLLADTNHLALACTHRTLALNQVEGVSLHSSLEIPANQVSTVIMLPPRGRAQGRAWLALAASLLPPGGRLYLAGANDEGIQSLIKDAAALFGACEVLAFRKGSRVALSLRSDTLQSPDWLEEPGVCPGTFRIQTIAPAAGTPLTIHSLPGVFSYEHLDDGSALLMEHLDQILAGLPTEANLLDVGCGYGILGMAAARRLPSAQVSLVDIDLAAIACARKNIESNAIANARTFPSDLLDACANQRYHLILSNPPFHTGKQVRYDATQALIAQSPAHLQPGGALILVANRFIRYEKDLRVYFSEVQTLAETRQFHLLRAAHPFTHPHTNRKEL